MPIIIGGNTHAGSTFARDVVPDTQVYWMRRLFALLVKYATRDGFYTPGEDVPADYRPAYDPTEAGGISRRAEGLRRG